jgi:hypothetical protein
MGKTSGIAWSQELGLNSAPDEDTAADSPGPGVPREINAGDEALGTRSPLETVIALSIVPFMPQLTQALFGFVQTVWVEKATGTRLGLGHFDVLCPPLSRKTFMESDRRPTLWADHREHHRLEGLEPRTMADSSDTCSMRESGSIRRPSKGLECTPVSGLSPSEEKRFSQSELSSKPFDRRPQPPPATCRRLWDATEPHLRGFGFV